MEKFAKFIYPTFHYKLNQLAIPEILPISMNIQQDSAQNALDTSSISSEQQILPSLHYYNQSMKPVSSFEQAHFFNPSQIKTQFQPICLIYESPYSTIVKCLKISVPGANQQQKSLSQSNYYALKSSNSVAKQIEMAGKIHMANPQCSTIIKNLEHFSASFVMEYYSCSLRLFLIENQFIFQPLFILNLFKKSVDMLLCLQKAKVVHGDIKPDNILVKIGPRKSFDFVLSDFSHSFSFEETPKKYMTYQMEQSDSAFDISSFQYTAPELLSQRQEKAFYEKVDIWGAGAVLFQVITTQSIFPFQTSTLKKYKQWSPKYLNRQNLLQRLQQQPYKALRNQNFYQTITKMLEQDPEDRLNLKELQSYCKKLMIKYSI